MAEGAQKGSLRRAIGAAGSQAKVTVQKLADGSVRAMINRAGTGGVFYYFSDHLKTASVITDSQGNIKSESDLVVGQFEFPQLWSSTNNLSLSSCATPRELCDRGGVEGSREYFICPYCFREFYRCIPH